MSTSSNVFETPSGNFVALGFTFDTISYLGHFTLLGLNNQGNQIWRKDYGTAKFAYLPNILAQKQAVVCEGNCFYTALAARDSITGQFGVLIKFNYNGDTLWQKAYRDTLPKDVIPQGLTRSCDGGFLITGFSQETSAQACLLIKTDNLGNEIWRRRVHKNTPDVSDGHGIVQDSATKRILIVGYQYIGNSTSWDTYSNILILDSLGNKILQTTLNNAGGGGFYDILQLKDKNFIVGGAWYAGQNANLTNLYRRLIVKFDVNGNIIWKKIFENPSPTNGNGFQCELKNGDIAMVADQDTGSTCYTGWILKTQITKFDKNGNLIFKKCIGSANRNDPNSSETPISLFHTKNNGFIISTEFIYALNPRPYSIIRLDSTGCDTTEAYCRAVEVGFGRMYGLMGFNCEVFPNPSLGEVNLKISAPSEKSFIVVVKEMSGKEIESLPLNANDILKIDLTGKAPGLYLLNVLYIGNVVETKKLTILR